MKVFRGLLYAVAIEIIGCTIAIMFYAAIHNY